MILRGEKGVPVQTGGAAVYKGMIRAVVLSLIFVGALFGFGAMANHTRRPDYGDGGGDAPGYFHVSERSAGE